MIGTLLDKIDTFRAARVRQRSLYRQAMDELPATLYPYWKRTAQFEFKGIPHDAFFFARAAEGLLTFFACVRASRDPCALPSAAADSVWHAWSKLAPAGLDAFCIKHFGSVIPHVEAADMRGQMEGALANCMVQARLLQGLDPVAISVPRLFSLDRRLRMPDGYGYRLARGDVAYRRLDGDGKPKGELNFTKGLMASQLLAGGLITQASYEEWMKKPSAGAGSSCGSIGSACDGGGCDGGAACGSSCGSGCGGGCGS